jgi:hypothetical protein
VLPPTNAARKVIKGSRWLLLKYKAAITREEDRVRLEDLPDAKRNQVKGYVLKEDLKQPWEY